MKQHDAINTILEQLVINDFVEACYLTGAIVTSPEDEEIIDFHIVLKHEQLKNFLNHKVNILSKYNDILYLEIKDNRIICVYDNDVFINLYYYLLNQLFIDTDYIGIYDPNKILEKRKITKEIDANYTGGLINEFALSLNEFYFSYKYNKKLVAFRKAFEILEIYTKIQNLDYDKFVNNNPLLTYLPKANDKYFEILKVMKFDNYLIAVSKMVISINKMIGNLPISVAQAINYDYFLKVKSLIFSLLEE